MKPYRLMNKLDCSKDLNKDIALKFDADKVKSEKYGEATLCGYLLRMTRHGEFPAVNVKQIEERAYGWLKEIELEEYEDEMFRKNNVPHLVAYSAPCANPEKLGLYFKLCVLFLLIDDDLVKLNHLNANDQIQQQKDISRLAKSLVAIIESKGDGNLAEMAASTNPMFKATCKSLSHICRTCSKQMSENEYTRFGNELLDYFRVNKWLQENCGLPYSENDYLFLRCASIGMYPIIYSICLASDIYIPSEIILHPLFQRYIKNSILHIALSNDMVSLRKEIADNEEENIVLVRCRKYSLQKSFHKTENAVNELVIDLKKDQVKLNLYFPADHNLKNFIKTLEYLADGYLHSYQHIGRYGKMKFENYVVEYDCDYNTWLEKISKINKKSMEEPVMRVTSNNGAFLSAFPSPPASYVT